MWGKDINVEGGGTKEPAVPKAVGKLADRGKPNPTTTRIFP
jgi:hypothetical protein